SITITTPSHHLSVAAAINLKIVATPSHPLTAMTTVNLKIVATISNQPIRQIGDPYAGNLVAAKSYYIYIANSCP
ncbi:hypothetical protein BHE74_00049636, partial [Ensete ventricosum]